MANVDNLNFKVILDDKDFNTRVEKDIELAKKLNVELSQLLQAKVKVNAISATEAASAKRASDILTKQATNQEKISQAKAKTAEAEEKVATQAAKTAKEMERSRAAASQTAVNVQRLATEQERTAAATQNASAATSRAALAQKRLADYSKQTTNSISSQSRLMNELKGYALGYLSIHGASQLISSLVRVTGEFELQKTTLAAMLGDLNKAEQIITRIQGLAVESPFQFKELTTYAKQLSAFAVPAEEIYETTKMLADVSAGLGVGMDRIVLAYGQVRSAAFLRGQEVRQFTEAGIPILDELAKQFTELEGRAVSTGEVFDKISARLVPFEMVAKVFKDMTSEGGKFYNMQEVQAETLRGKISNLKDAYEVMLNEIGSAHSDKLKGAVDWVRSLTTNYEKVGRTLKQCIITFGVAKTSIELLAVFTGQLAAKNIGLVASFRKVAIAAAANPYVALGAAVTAFGVGIYKVATALTDVEKIQKNVSESNDKYTNSLAKELGVLDELYAKLELAKEGSLEYDKAKSRIQSKYSSYIDQLKQEGIEVNNLADIYVNLAEKIQKSLMVRSKDEATKNLDAVFNNVLSENQKKFDQLLKNAQKTYKLSFNTTDREALRQFIFGNMTKDEVFSVASDQLKMYFKKVGKSGTIYMLKENMKSALDAYIVGMDDISAAYEVFEEATGKSINKLAEGWRKQVQDALKKLGLDKGTSFGLWAEDTTQSAEYVEDMVKRYKEINEQIKLVSPFDKEQTDRLKQNRDAIEAVAKALKIDIKELAASKGEQAESKEEKRIKRLVDALRTLQDQYEKLKAAGASDKSIQTLFEGLYPDLIKENGKEFVTDLNYLERAVGLVAELEKISPDDAKKLLVSLGKDEFSVYLKNLEKQNKAYKDAASASKEYFNLLRKWQSEDFNIEGEGIALDIDKISTGLASKIGEIDLKTRKLQELFDQIGISDTSKRSEEAIAKIKEIFEKEFGEGSWDKFYEEFLSKGDSAFKTLADKEIAYERKIAQEKITNLAKAYVGDMTEKLDLSDWGDKSLGQIEYIRKELLKLMNADISIPDSLRKEIELLGLNMVDLIDKIKELFGGKFDTATIEKIKAVQDAAKGVSSYFQKVGESLAALGESMNSNFLKGAAKAVSLLGNMADAIMESESLMAKLTLKFGDVSNLSKEATENLENIAKSSDWITIVIKVILSAVTAVSNVIATQRKNMELAADAVIAYKNALSEIQREKADIFGSSQVNILVENLNAAAEAYSYFKKELDLVMSQDRGMGGWYLPSIGGEGGEGYWFDTYSDLRSLLKNETFESEKEMMEYLKANIDYWESLTHLSDGERTTAQLETEIRILIKAYEAWDDANKKVRASMTELFGQLGNDIASNMINSFLEVGKATANLEESFESLGETIVHSFLKSAIIDDFLIPRLEKISDLMTQAVYKEISLDDLATQLGNVAGEIKSDLAGMGPIWEEILASFQENGLLPDSESSAADLDAGIKGITEDTANLLASYLNAIRADVSYSKTLWARMDGNLQRIADMFAGSPSLMEYQAQIAANTYNTSISTRNILIELQSVIGYGDEGRAVRIIS